MKTDKNRRSAALLIVIGLLSLLLIAAVAFSVLMSLERSAASNYRHSVQARHMLYAGLAQAISDINANVGDNYYPVWNETNTLLVSGATSRLVAHKADVFQSVDYSQMNVCYARVLSQDAMKYIPKSLQQAVETVQPECLPFTGYNGRYAYVAVNVSGLLDANYVFTTNRWLGMTPGEIQVDPGVLFDVIDANLFAVDRNANGRYETIDELGRFNRGINSNKLSNFETFSYAKDTDLAPDGHPKLYIGGNLEARLNDTPYYPGETGISVSNRLRTVLKYPDMLGYYDFRTNDIFVGSPSLSIDEADWRVNNFISCMLDYTGNSTVPRNLGAPKILNEYCISTVQWDPVLHWYTSPSFGRFTFIQNLVVRAYNFAGSTGNPHVANVSINFSSVPTVVSPVSLRTLLGSLFVQRNITLSSWTGTGPGEITAMISITNNSISPPASVSSSTLLLDGKPLTAYVMVSLSNAVATVDQVPANWGSSTNSFIFDNALSSWAPASMALNLILVSPPTLHNWWYEAFDPRMNWSADKRHELWFMNTDQTPAILGMPGFIASMSSLNLANWVLTHPSDAYNNGSGKWIQRMFDGMGQRADTSPWSDDFNSQKTFLCPNRPFQSVGELAYILIDRWQTPRVFDHGDYAPILGIAPNLPQWVDGSGCTNRYCRFFDYFTMTPPPATATQTLPKRGLVNINTRNTNVLAAAFFNMPIHDWNPAYTGSGLTASQALFLAQTVTNYILSSIPSGYATNSGVLGMIPWTGNNITSALGMSNEMDRKAVMRNAMALFTARQQIYTIIVRADAMSFEYARVVQGSGASANPLNNGTVLGSAHAVFQVWRDPMPDANGKHPCFVRLCKILSL